MTEQEQQLISDLAERIRNTPAPAIDRTADELIRRSIGTRPDALYLMTQLVLMQQMALNQARNQIESLQQQRPAGGGSFLGSGYAQPEYPPQGYAPQQGYAPPPPPGGGFSNFLHNAASTAAGVFAGEVVFDSLASLFGHRGGGSGFFGGGGGGTYFDDSQAGDSRFADAASQNQDISPDIEDDRNSSGGDDLSGSGDDFSGDDNS